jgi:hypothetical protein
MEHNVHVVDEVGIREETVVYVGAGMLVYLPSWDV